MPDATTPFSRHFFCTVAFGEAGGARRGPTLAVWIAFTCACDSSTTTAGDAIPEMHIASRVSQSQGIPTAPPGEDPWGGGGGGGAMATAVAQ